MADEITVAMNVGSKALDTLSSYVWVGLVVVVIAVVVLLLIYLMSFRHQVLIKIIGSRGVKYPYKDNAKPILVDGVLMWKLKKRKDVIPPPPKECIIPNGKDFWGKPKYYAECYFSEELGYVWSEDTVGSSDFVGRIEKDSEGTEVIKGVYQPVTTQERTLLVSQVIKAQTRKKKNLLEQITALAVPMVLVLLVVMILVFWEDIAKPVKEMSSIQAGIAKENAEISNQNARMLSILAGKLEAGDIVVKQNVPPDSGGVK